MDAIRSHIMREQLEKRIQATTLSTVAWKRQRLPVGIKILDVGKPKFSHLDDAYSVARDVIYRQQDSKNDLHGRFVVTDTDPATISFIGASGETINDAPFALETRSRVLAKLPPFTTETPFDEMLAHIAYWCAENSDPLHGRDISLYGLPEIKTFGDEKVSAHFKARYFEETSLVPSDGVFRVTVKSDMDILEAVCLREDGTVFRTVPNNMIRKVYKDAAIADPNPREVDRDHLKNEPVSEGIAEREWRAFEFPPEIRIVAANPVYAVQEGDGGFMFNREFGYEEDGELSLGMLQTYVGDDGGTLSLFIKIKGGPSLNFEPEKLYWEDNTDAPESEHEAVWRLANKYASLAELNAKFDAKLTGPYSFIEDVDTVKAVRTIKYWQPDHRQFGREFEVNPAYSTFELTMDKGTNEILKISHAGMDGDVQLMGIAPRHRTALHELANVPLRKDNGPKI
jgi:hypothetical protein